MRGCKSKEVLFMKVEKNKTWAGNEVGFDFSNANLNLVWAMTAYRG